MHEFSYSISICGKSDETFKYLTNLPILFALNPQWDVKTLENVDNIKQGSKFNLKVKYDRTEEEKDINATIEDFLEPNLISINLSGDESRKIIFNLSQSEDKTNIEFREIRSHDFSIEEKRELIYWVRSIGNYQLICKRKTPWGRLWRWFVDRVWLKMSPAGRRMVFMIVLFEALTILLLVAFIIFKFFM